MPKLEQRNSRQQNDLDRVNGQNKDLNDRNNLLSEEVNQLELQVRGLL